MKFEMYVIKCVTKPDIDVYGVTRKYFVISL